MSDQNYELQVKVPYWNSEIGRYEDGEGFWNGLEKAGDPATLRAQRRVLEGFWKHVRIVELEHVVIEEREVE